MERIMEPYALKRELIGVSFAEAVDRTRKALVSQGFGIPVEMDMQAIFRQKLGKESGARLILGACLASVAFEVLAVEPDIAVLLPCNVVVSEIRGGCAVTAVSPKTLFSLVSDVEPAYAIMIEGKINLVLQEVTRSLPASA
jgi:uncharacterized protein (DUF302 family)